MGVEIERKFRVRRERLPTLDASAASRYVQGYLCTDPVVRVRLESRVESPQRGWLTIKGRGQIERAEFEYAIPPSDARAMLDLCAATLSKDRHRIVVDGHTWEVDEFTGRHEGLWLAEIELDHADEVFTRPDWLGDEVTHDARYTNASLAMRGSP